MKAIVMKIDGRNLSQLVNLQRQYNDMTEDEAKEFCEWEGLQNEDDNYARIVDSDIIKNNGMCIIDEEDYIQIACVK